MKLIIVDFYIQPQAATLFEDIMLKMRQKALSENGCQRYELAVSTHESNRYTLTEIWLSEDTHSLHLGTLCFKEFSDKIASMVISKSEFSNI